jgi:putative ABC transport system permease protein
MILRRLRRWIAELTGREALDRAIDDEFELHVDLLANDLERRGAPRDEAVRQARLAFGNLTVAKEKAREAKGLAWLDTVSQDVRFTARTLRRNAGFTAVAVLSLGFGIGAATTVFSVVDALDFRPLPYANADRLVWLAEVMPPDDRMCAGCASYTSAVTARDWIAQSRSYDALVVTTHSEFTWEHDDVEESPRASLTTPGLLSLFGLRPVVGRDLEAADTLPGAEPVVLLTYDFWEARFGRDPSIVGKQLRARMGGFMTAPRPITIVGVMPKDFQVMPEFKLWGPMSIGSATSRTDRSATVIARLKPQTSIAAASAELQGLSERLARSYPKEFRGWGARVEPLRERLEWGAGKGRGVLFAVTLAVLLIAVLNVTGLLFGRAAARQPEFAMRAALGAGRMRLFRQLLVEGSCIGLCGGLIGIALAFGGVHVAARWFSIGDSGLSLGVDHRVLTFAVLLSLLVGVTAAVAPAGRTARMDATRRLRQRTTADARASHTSNVLITAQIALALVLLTAASLLSHDFLELRYLDLGYNPRGVFQTSVSAPREQWSNPGPWKTVATQTRARVAEVHGVQSASLEYENAMHPAVVRSDVSGESTSERKPRVKAVSPDFFSTWDNAVLIGRTFSTADRTGAPLVAIVNKACASAFWPGLNPLGRRVFLGDSASGGEWLTVVGVTEDFERGGFARRHNPVIYRPFEQAQFYHPAVFLSVRVADDRPEILASAQSAIREVTGRRNAPFENAEDELGRRVLAPRFNAIALDAFAAFGLLLAAMGIYGSIAFAVTQRTREIGIRVALGAARASVLQLIARRGVVVATVGSVIGLDGSLALTRVFKSFVSATSVTNPWIFGTSVLVVLAVALVATFIPARRAAGVNPVIALRAE